MSNMRSPNNNSNFSTSGTTAKQTVSMKKEYLNLLPPLSDGEFDSLKQSIREEGLHVPVILNKQGIVLDGHHRFRASKDLAILLKYQTKEFNDSLDEKQFLIDVNLRRRQLNEFQRVESVTL